MEEKRDTAGIYARKSLFTGKGESIQNQINMCSEYARSKGWDVKLYTDEGYSGGSTDRPGFQELLGDIDRGKLQNVVFYRLDRISRRILDICEFIEQLNTKNVGFISITESFDTTSPLGRAMVHIAATFAQLEREMLAQRVKDNMMQLSKTGRWLGGTTPTGYKSKKITCMTEDLKKKSMYLLEEIPEELELVRLIFDKYIALRSLHSLEKYCMKNNITSKNNKCFQKLTLRAILTNPVYIKADTAAYEYFNELGIQIANPPEDFDGIHGLMTYNKNIEKKGKANELREHEEWIMAVGRHGGIIDSRQWIAVQEILQGNKSKAPRSGTGAASLLSGLVVCGKCGSYMKVKYGQTERSTGKRIGYFVCSRKELSEGSLCDCANVRVDILEEIVARELLKLPWSRKHILGVLSKQGREVIVKAPASKTQELRDCIAENERKISGLLDKLEDESKDSPAVKRIMERIDKLEGEIEEMRESLKKSQAAEGTPDFLSDGMGVVVEALGDFPMVYTNVGELAVKRGYFSSVIQSIKWQDGEVEVFTKGGGI